MDEAVVINVRWAKVAYLKFGIGIADFDCCEPFCFS